MNSEVRLAIATAVLQGIVADRFRDNECNGHSMLGAEPAARLAFEYADAEAARPSPAPAWGQEEAPRGTSARPAPGEDFAQPKQGARRAREIADGIPR